jgi:hypothetical protein
MRGGRRYNMDTARIGRGWSTPGEKHAPKPKSPDSNGHFTASEGADGAEARREYMTVFLLGCIRCHEHARPTASKGFGSTWSVVAGAGPEASRRSPAAEHNSGRRHEPRRKTRASKHAEREDCHADADIEARDVATPPSFGFCRDPPQSLNAHHLRACPLLQIASLVAHRGAELVTIAKHMGFELPEAPPRNTTEPSDGFAPF